MSVGPSTHGVAYAWHGPDVLSRFALK